MQNNRVEQGVRIAVTTSLIVLNVLTLLSGNAQAQASSLLATTLYPICLLGMKLPHRSPVLPPVR
ncbi:hypothetical protein HZC27_04640 [Candidatus Roizmanbacteria bacterium]|nr:hypothetical protein [Candidatus Roizmanbacteria bacterium]